MKRYIPSNLVQDILTGRDQVADKYVILSPQKHPQETDTSCKSPRNRPSCNSSGFGFAQSSQLYELAPFLANRQWCCLCSHRQVLSAPIAIPAAFQWLPQQTNVPGGDVVTTDEQSCPVPLNIAN